MNGYKAIVIKKILMKKVFLGVGGVAVVAVFGVLAYFAMNADNQQMNLSAYTGDEYLHVMFEHFKGIHHKTYFNQEEEEYRRNIFIDHVKEVNAHNAKGLSWTKEINKFSDLTDQEFKRLYLGYKPSGEQVPEQEISGVELASSVDWNKKGAVAGVKDQGQCGSCWAFSTVAGVEGAYEIKYGKLKTFSEQELVDCVKAYDGCDGGDIP